MSPLVSETNRLLGLQITNLELLTYQITLNGLPSEAFLGLVVSESSMVEGTALFAYPTEGKGSQLYFLRPFSQIAYFWVLAFQLSTMILNSFSTQDKYSHPEMRLFAHSNQSHVSFKNLSFRAAQSPVPQKTASTSYIRPQNV